VGFSIATRVMFCPPSFEIARRAVRGRHCSVD
jgi:hypothetical protein